MLVPMLVGYEQGCMFPKGIETLSPSAQEAILTGEEGKFRNEILPLIPAGLVQQLYDASDACRPAYHGVNYIAAMIYMRRLQMNESTFIRLVKSSPALQYAIGMDEFMDQRFPINRDTFYDLRKRLLHYANEHDGVDLLEVITHSIDMQLALKMNLFEGYNSKYLFGIRLDSEQVDMRATPRTRLELLYLSMANLIAIVIHEGRAELIPAQLMHFTKEGDFRQTCYFKGTLNEFKGEGFVLPEKSSKEAAAKSEKKEVAADTTVTVPSSTGETQQTSDAKTADGETKVEANTDEMKPVEKAETTSSGSKASDKKLEKAASSSYVRKELIGLKRLGELVTEAVLLKDALCNTSFKSLEEYDIFTTILEQQTKLDAQNILIPKENGEISANSIQSPYEPEGTYRDKHGAHHGYVSMQAEVFNQDGDGIVIYRQMEPNTYQDTQFMQDFQENCLKQIAPPEGKRAFLATDAAFVSKTLNLVSHELGFDTYCAGVHGGAPNKIFADFTIEHCESGLKFTCPEGHTSEWFSQSGDVFSVHFKDKCCANCPHAAECAAKTTGGDNPSRGSSTVKVSETKIAAALCLKMIEENTDPDFTKYINSRNAIEGIMSIMRRVYHIDEGARFGLFWAREDLYLSTTANNIGKYFSWLDKKAKADKAAKKKVKDPNDLSTLYPYAEQLTLFQMMG